MWTFIFYAYTHTHIQTHTHIYIYICAYILFSIVLGFFLKFVTVSMFFGGRGCGVGGYVFILFFLASDSAIFSSSYMTFIHLFLFTIFCFIKKKHLFLLLFFLFYIFLSCCIKNSFAFFILFLFKCWSYDDEYQGIVMTRVISLATLVTVYSSWWWNSSN